MCGIAGIVAGTRLYADERERVARMRDVIAHRGPTTPGCSSTIRRRSATGA